jgi:hypothetical protein
MTMEATCEKNRVPQPLGHDRDTEQGGGEHEEPGGRVGPALDPSFRFVGGVHPAVCQTPARDLIVFGRGDLPGSPHRCALGVLALGLARYPLEVPSTSGRGLRGNR